MLVAPLVRTTSPPPRSRLAELSLINLGYSSPFPDRVNTSGPPKPLRPTHGMPVYQTSNISHPCVPNCTRSSSKTGAMIGAARSNGGRRRRPRRRQRPPSLTRPRTGLMPRGNPDNLRAAAQRKRREATERAEAALAELARRRQPVTFHGSPKPPASQSTSSTAPHYAPGSKSSARPHRSRRRRSTSSRRRPATARSSAPSPPRWRTQGPPPPRGHRIRTALAAAHGENLELRGKLGRRTHER